MVDTEQLRVKTGPVSPTVSTRDALLDAAYDAMVSGGWAQVRMADVAATAGLSRQTLYNEFGTKDGLAQALTLREVERFIEGTETALEEAQVHGPVAAITAAVAYTLREASGNPLLKATVADDSSGLLPFLTTRAQPVVDAARQSVRGYLVEHWPALPLAHIDEVTDTVVRLTISFIVLPPDDPDESVDKVASRIAQVVERLIVPSRRNTA